MWTIYALVDPRTNQICYVGQTQNHPTVRLEGHLQKRDDNQRKTSWLSELRGLSMKPLVVVLGYAASLDEALKDEREWIRRGTYAGWPLTNYDAPRFASHERVVTSAESSTEQSLDFPKGLTRRGVADAKTKLLNDALFTLANLLYEVDEDGVIANIDPVDNRVLVPLPWGRMGAKRWRLRASEARCFRHIMFDRLREINGLPPWLVYSYEERYWQVNIEAYPTPNYVALYLEHCPVTTDEWRNAWEVTRSVWSARQLDNEVDATAAPSTLESWYLWAKDNYLPAHPELLQTDAQGRGMGVKALAEAMAGECGKDVDAMKGTASGVAKRLRSEASLPSGAAFGVNISTGGA